MTPQALVRRALEFDGPPRTPRQLWVLPRAETHHPEAVARLRQEYPDDLVFAPPLYRTPPRTAGGRYDAGRYVDEWGCRFDNVRDGVLGTVRDPAIVSWDDLASFRTPDELLSVDAEAVNAFCRHTDRFVVAGTLIRPFERLGFLRTMQQALIDLAEQPPEFLHLLQRIHEHYLREVEVWSRTEVDAIFLMDDWGSQTGPLVSPQVFRQLFRPLYEEYAAIARRSGKYVFMHSDGQILAILEDLIACGVHALNGQIACMGPAEVGERFRGRLTFWGDSDPGYLEPSGAPATVAAAVREFHAHLSANGGVIALCEFGPGTSPDNVRQYFRAFRELDQGKP